MNKSVFDFSDYKSYLEARLGSKSQRKGIKSKAAEAINCQPTYISQVLHGMAHLSLEQADRLSEFLGHTKDESLHFMTLVQRDRAGTKSLKKYFSEQLDELQNKRMVLTQRLGKKNQLSIEKHSKYYSSWHYAAIHVALTVPELQTSADLSDHFKLPLRKVNSVLEFLLEAGLAIRSANGSFQTGSNFVRLGNDSPNILRHHSNWRQTAMDSLDREDVNDLHYSAVVSLSKKDVLRLKDQMLEEIKNHIDVIQSSKEEEIYCYAIDFFNLRR